MALSACEKLISMPGKLSAVKALLFDVSGTVVDRRGSIIREERQFGRAKQINIDRDACANDFVDLARQPGTRA